jgi:hypothetical protein
MTANAATTQHCVQSARGYRAGPRPLHSRGSNTGRARDSLDAEPPADPEWPCRPTAIVQKCSRYPAKDSE